MGMGDFSLPFDSTVIKKGNWTKGSTSLPALEALSESESISKGTVEKWIIFMV